ncbi:chaperonin 10-like protein [Rhodofomes roseus]|uniref:Chaperonin 10-like protein n=1 Tax=Rhodofomes roseus TaxID=34475 RepID=A0ABQ8KQV2_9APHY|nr:chaperonin 10-like protein [Rhodofomes roseus]KAH9840915.1 chaperonin 10-like protein [Rhodofomes roseus]
MKAIVTLGNGHFELKDVQTPRASAGEMLVKVAATAQNPVDWKTALLHKKPENILGCDFAGTVVEVGPEVPETLRHKGERVAGCIQGGVAPNGAFAEYVVMEAALAISLPDSVTFEEGAQLGIACFTSCLALYRCLKLPTPDCPATEPIPMLIWSGTSATGQYAIQFAKLSGLRVITTASPKHFDLVRSLGADEVYDYADSKTPRKIFAATGGTLRHAMDCISQDRTPNQVSTSLSKEGGNIATLLPYVSRSKGVQTQLILAYTILGKEITFPFAHPAVEEDHQSAVEYAQLISKLLSQGKIKHTRINLFPHGLQSVKDGFEYMGAGKVHAEKITYRISDTPGVDS